MEERSYRHYLPEIERECSLALRAGEDLRCAKDKFFTSAKRSEALVIAGTPDSVVEHETWANLQLDVYRHAQAVLDHAAAISRYL